MLYFFQLGHSPNLAKKELSTYLLRLKIKAKKTHLSPNELLIDTNKPLEDQILDVLAGTVRISQYLTQVPSDDISHQITNDLKKHSSTKPKFGLASTDKHLKTTSIAHQIKKQLKLEGISSRFILAQSKYLSPVIISKQSVNEYILIPNKTKIDIFKTIHVSDFKSWQQRDRNRPHVDPKSGILPPKVARMMLNIALPNPLSPKTTILDPFCGSGTILAEALTLGITALGSDISPKAIQDSQANLTWLQTQNSSPSNFKLIQKDARELTLSDIDNQQLDAIVAEGDLGPNTKQDLASQQQTLTQLYLLYQQSLTNLYPLLKDQAIVVIALPDYQTHHSVKNLDHLIDTCENSGYTLLTSPISYSRPNARVKRAICVLKKTNQK